MAHERLPRPSAPVWASYLTEWDRAMRAGSHPLTTRYNYQLAAHQLAGFLADHYPGPDDVSDAAEDPTEVTKAHVEEFLAWMAETRSKSSALNKYKGLQQFFNYLVGEDEIDRSPMERIKQPKPTEKTVPIVQDDGVTALLATCAGKDFRSRRDAAIIRSLFDCGGRLAEVTNLRVDDIDTAIDLFRLTGKGDRQRGVPFGPKTGQALTRYLRVRAKHRGAELDALWLADRGSKPMGVDGVKTMLRRRGVAAGMDSPMHAHRFRHTFAHAWLASGGNETDLMRLMGWRSRDMLLRYGASAGAERAQNAHRAKGLGDRV